MTEESKPQNAESIRKQMNEIRHQLKDNSLPKEKADDLLRQFMDLKAQELLLINE